MSESTVGQIKLSSFRYGRVYEIDVLGYCPPKDWIEPPKWDFESELWWVVFHQPEGYNSRDPSQGMNEDLFSKVSNLLPKKWRRFLRFFIAVGSGLDWHYGVDAFFYLNDDSIVTLDVTLDPYKSYKADVLITPREMDPERGRISPSLVQDIAHLLILRCQKTSLIKPRFSVKSLTN